MSATGVYIYIGKYPPPPGRYQPMSLGKKMLKEEEKKGENVPEKGRKGK
jgi:hypothetical protein